jgi:tRNA modification GTPase
LSGPSSLNILQRLIDEPLFVPEPKRLSLNQIRGESGEQLDSALVCFFEAPHSFTGEDMAEISCHGSPLILRHVLDLIQNFGGRLADAGEFTLRACKNGKMNLTQAEAVRDLINARSDAAMVQALRQLNGELSNALQPAKQALIRIIVRLESALEFVEDDLPRIEAVEIERELQTVIETAVKLAATFASGRGLREGIKVTIIGAPNVGKSSIFNRLAGLDRAIVTEIAGTTRDTISEAIVLRGMPVWLTDTAGIREAAGRIEELGVQRTHRAAADADLLVITIDGSREMTVDEMAIVNEGKKGKHVVAINKSDLPNLQHVDNRLTGSAKVVHVSAVTGEGLDQLTTAILEPFGSVDSETVGLLITDSRHYDLLRRAQISLEDSRELLKQAASEELVLVGLQNALRFLGEITGETTADEILGEIFSTFCIGK